MGQVEVTKMDVTIYPAGKMGGLSWRRWLINSVRFFLSVFSLYLGFVSGNLEDGFQWQDLLLNAFMLGVLVKYLIDTIQDLITKWTTETKYADGEKV